MQGSVLPSDVKLKDWVYTLVGLSVFTLLLVVNLSHVTRFIRFVGTKQESIWNSLLKCLSSSTGFMARLKRRETPGKKEEIEPDNQVRAETTSAEINV